MPKNFANRSAVSAVMLRRHFVISVSREAGIAVARETAASDKSIGRMNSSRRISPGWMSGSVFFLLIVLMVIGYFAFCLTAIFPSENDPPLLVDSDTPETTPITSERFQTITRWNREILQRTSLIEHAQLPPRPVLYVPRKLA